MIVPADGFCVVEVWEDWNRRRCTRKGKMVIGSRIGGLTFCWQHERTFKKRGEWVVLLEGNSEFIKSGGTT